MLVNNPIDLVAPVNSWGDEAIDVPRRRRVSRRPLLITLCLFVLVAMGFWSGYRVAARTNTTNGVLPGDFETHEALLVGVPPSSGLHPVEFGNLIEIIAAAQHSIDVLVLVPEAGRRHVAEALTEAGAELDAVEFIDSQITLPWVRDYGPHVLKCFDGRYRILDASYDRPDFPGCDEVPEQLGFHLNLQVVKTPLILDGGNLLSNGAGLCLTTHALVALNAQERDYGESQVTRMLKKHYGATKVVYLEPLDGEPTGHVDMFATFTSADTVVVGEYETDVDPRNARILDRNAEVLSKIRTSCGPLRVERIPMPRLISDFWESYTNVVYANGVLLMPTYEESDTSIEDQAAATYERLLPRWRVVRVDATGLIHDNGGPHCATMNLLRRNAK